jgi:hypothetical protein
MGTGIYFVKNWTWVLNSIFCGTEIEIHVFKKK